MSSNLETILTELYALDPSLVEFEPQVKLVVVKLLALRPNPRFDIEFARNLHAELLSQIQPSSQELVSVVPRVKRWNWLVLPKPAHLYFGVTVFAFLAVLLGGYRGASKYLIALQEKTPTITQLVNEATKLFSGTSLINTNPQAFGDLTELALNKNMPSNLGIGAGASPIDGMGGGGAVDFMVSPSDNSVGYRFIYNGEPIDLQPALNMKVYQRQLSGDLKLKNLGLNNTMAATLLDLNKNGEATVSAMNFDEVEEFGHQLTINWFNETIFFNEYWKKWPNIWEKCNGDPTCLDKLALTKTDLPPDKEIFRAANSFLTDKGIDVSIYGVPHLPADWPQIASTPQVPENILVEYPSLITNLPVYDFSGSPENLTVNVNLRYSKVSGLSGLRSQNYLGSEYQQTTDWNKLSSLIEHGGLTYGRTYETAATVTEVKISTPHFGYYHDSTQEKDGQLVELFIPSLIFPVISEPTSPVFYAQNIIVPLPVEMVDALNAKINNEQASAPQNMPTSGTGDTNSNIPPATIPLGTSDFPGGN